MGTLAGLAELFRNNKNCEIYFGPNSNSFYLCEKITKCLCFVQALDFCSTPQLELCRPFLADFIMKKSLIIMKSQEMWANWMLKSLVLAPDWSELQLAGM